MAGAGAAPGSNGRRRALPLGCAGAGGGEGGGEPRPRRPGEERVAEGEDGDGSVIAVVARLPVFAGPRAGEGALRGWVGPEGLGVWERRGNRGGPEVTGDSLSGSGTAIPLDEAVPKGVGGVMRRCWAEGGEIV